MEPICSVAPTTSPDISEMAKILANDECNSPFSGVEPCIGREPGVSNIQDGVTVDLGHMNGIQVHTQGGDKVAKLGPGCTRGDVCRALQTLNLAVPRGVMDRMGVGDFLLRGK
jgi:hypothetical protein